MGDKCRINRGVVVDARVTAEFPIDWYEWSRYDKETKRRVQGGPEDLAACLEHKCEEFVDFLRDHRSQDVVQLFVERVRKDQCSECGEEWDPVQEAGSTFCGWCGAELENENAVKS